MIRADYRDMADDEKTIGSRYTKGRILAPLYCAVVVGGFYAGGERVAYLMAFWGVYWFLSDISDRLYDLTVRLSRTNELLVDGVEELRIRKGGC
jgi:hypothetical protein